MRFHSEAGRTEVDFRQYGSRRVTEEIADAIYGNDVFRATQRALSLYMASRIMQPRPLPDEPELPTDSEVFNAATEWTRPDGFVLINDPCGCDFCAITQAREEMRGKIDRIMAGVDMPGRIVDDVRPDQRGESS